ncbi:MAG: hypothetical protein C4323_21090 [Mastigocladus sp. ERB_26_2]
MNIEQAVLDSLRILPKKNNRNRTYVYSTNPWHFWRLGGSILISNFMQRPIMKQQTAKDAKNRRKDVYRTHLGSWEKG